LPGAGSVDADDVRPRGGRTESSDRLDGVDSVEALFQGHTAALRRGARWARVGFARAITDGVFLAVALDDIVDTDYRGSGLGARLMDELLRRPELADVDSIELVCQPELINFYERWGFTDAVGRSLLMRRTANSLLVRPDELSNLDST